MNWSVRALVIVQCYYCWSLCALKTIHDIFQFGGATAAGIFSQKTASAKVPTRLTGSNACTVITRRCGGSSMKNKRAYLDPNDFSNK